MGNPYPATFIDQNNEGRLVGEVDFTDAANRPGGGGSSWVGPYAFSAADYNPALGSGWDGILIEDALPAGLLLLRIAYAIDVTIDVSSTLVVYAGTLAGDDFAAPSLTSDASGYGSGVAVVSFAVGTFGTSPVFAGLQTGPGVSQVWVDSFAGPPNVGSGRLWLELATPVAPT